MHAYYTQHQLFTHVLYYRPEYIHIIKNTKNIYVVYVHVVDGWVGTAAMITIPANQKKYNLYDRTII